MINNNKLLYILSFALMLMIGCEDTDDSNTAEQDTSISTPTEFVFESRFSEGESSVYYNGQVVRQLLINDIKTQCGTDAGSGDASTLLSMMANDESRTILTSTSRFCSVYIHSIAQPLNDRLAAVADYTCWLQ